MYSEELVSKEFGEVKRIGILVDSENDRHDMKMSSLSDEMEEARIDLGWAVLASSLDMKMGDTVMVHKNLLIKTSSGPFVIAGARSVAQDGVRIDLTSRSTGEKVTMFWHV